MSSSNKLILTLLLIPILCFYLGDPDLSYAGINKGRVGSNTELTASGANFKLSKASNQSSKETVSGFHDPFATGKISEGEPDSRTIPDPFKQWNEWMFKFNITFFEYIGRPVAEAYRDYTPEPFRDGMRNAFQNIYEPSNTVNSLLQGDLDDADTSASRFVINTTFGAGGFYDVADKYLKRRPHDFDQTLGKWGMEPSFYVVWPFIGPSSGRGSIGLLVDSAMDPINYIDSSEGQTLATTYRLISETSYELDRFESLKKFTVDQYAAVKDVYENRVYRKVHGSDS